jgi:triacylglycerol esterase/lipase EstA (alpha/beta hydrolase family)
VVRGAVVLVALALAGVAAGAAAAGPGRYAPLDRPGPPLHVPAAKLRASLRCTAGVRRGMSRAPILLVPGTNLDPAPNYYWNYMRAFRRLRWSYCSVTLPHHAMGDVQLAGEYVVHALRSIARRTGRRVDVLGYSQGGMLPRWALRFWPGTRGLVRKLVALDPSNHGTLDSEALCQASCPPAYWQQASGAAFIAALNSGAETFRGIAYTVVYSQDDEVVFPNLDARGSSSLHGPGGVRNVAVQEVCPGHVADHLAMGSYDPVGYWLAVGALAERRGAWAGHPASPPCGDAVQPGVDKSTFVADYAGFVAAIGRAAQESPETPTEPPLRCYVLARCRAR